MRFAEEPRNLVHILVDVELEWNVCEEGDHLNYIFTPRGRVGEREILMQGKASDLPHFITVVNQPENPHIEHHEEVQTLCMN